jgi:hypothetical protein
MIQKWKANTLQFAKKVKSKAFIWVSREKVVLLPEIRTSGAYVTRLCYDILTDSPLFFYAYSSPFPPLG